MDDFYYEEDSKNVFLKCLIILFIIGIIIGSLFYYKKTQTIQLKKITLELGEKLSTNVNDYIINKKSKYNYKLNLDNVDETKVGIYTYKIKYNKHTKNGKIYIKDTKSPEIESNKIILNINDEFNEDDLIVKCEDYSKPCKIDITTKNIDELLNNIGEYKVEFTVSDSNGNKTKGETSITVSDTQETSSLLSNDLEYASNNLNDDTIEHIYFKKLDKAIKEDSFVYEEIYANITSIDFKEINPEIYKTEIITIYNKYKYVIGFQIRATYNDGTNSLLEQNFGQED